MSFYNSKLPQHQIRSWYIGDDDFDIDVRVNGFRFRITVAPKCFINSSTAISRFRGILEKLSAGEDDILEVWSYCESVAGVFVADFQRLAPATAHRANFTLAEMGIKGNFDCEYLVVDEMPCAGAVTGHVPDIQPVKEWDMRALQDAFPVFSPGEVEIIAPNSWNIDKIIPRKVNIYGKTYFYKPTVSPYDAIDSVNKYTKLNTVRPGRLLTSRLFGIVANYYGHGEGLIYDWIYTRDGETLTNILDMKTPSALREKWVSQIRHTLAVFHGLGVIWGDVKAENVLIDTDDNAIIIDLEGGTTRGWVDSHVEGTVAGDLQGLARLVDFVMNDESPLRQGL